MKKIILIALLVCLGYNISHSQAIKILGENIIERETETITISNNQLQPGMYLYTLLVDGREIDTKKMIITD